MPLASDADHDENWSTSDKGGQGQAVSTNQAINRLRPAANSPTIRQKPSQRSAARPGLAEFHIKRQATLLEVLADFTDQLTLPAALLAIANDLKHRFQCDRIAIGLVIDSKIQIAAISQQAVIEARTDEIRLLREAMQEACDQGITIDYSGASTTSHTVECHHALAEGQASLHICTIPLCDKETVIGALLLQRRAEQSWSRMTLELLTQIAALAAPLIALRRDAERSAVQMIRMQIRSNLASLIAPKELIAKATAVILVLLLVLAYVFPVTHHVKASAEIVPTERRVIAAPISGFINRVFVNAGDLVRTGDSLIRLDTRELELTLAGQENQILSARAHLRAVMAGYDRNELAIAQAELDQIEAELALSKQQLSRTTMTAPIDGVIVSGDLSQSLGMSVERGKVLLEMAPADGYDVHLLVHETDVSYVQPGQTGRLSLAADPGTELLLDVSAIHPIAQANGGVNRFLVEATLQQGAAGLRPGQTGMVKLAVGEASLLWLWTHRFVEWGRQRLWEWLG
ncbi:efflux RND transporter periplasmic adaptor subunit [Granulosicoccus antarcticus]|uniref:p-hydroxybenzoic acid efflux pump subunit AaeA n=1 Tax=Granulosicoccus antarcticus IMCC3135 TaxID=1192854 RepID=A0A2Z2NHK8_9GAMM|nr:efflux RND transporter periplasmic adaptor subunit [Granulosicoccus antarcticus]ASJ70629.1 p-hydroxybenzoic acid efflux pump subunit AaeA [Granulosicoccus antarcticus IMCC3135]